MKQILIGMGGLLLCILTIIISKIHNSNRRSSLIQEEDDRDVIDKFSNFTQTHLRSRPWAMPYGTYKLLVTTSAIVLGAVAALLTSNLLIVALAASTSLLIPEVIIMVQSSRLKAAYEDRYATGLRELVVALKSGLSVNLAVKSVCKSPFIHDSVREEFQRIDADLELGISLQEAFSAHAARIGTTDAQDVATAVAMQSQTSGREAQCIELIAGSIRDRIALRKEIASLFAGSNATVLAMDIAPIAIIIAMYFMLPGYMTVYFSSSIMLTVFIALIAFMGFGSIAVHRTISKSKKECGV